MTKYPRIIIAATSSGTGKTTVTCSLLQALVNRGLNPCAFKCGPDYIDPMYHRKVIGIPSGNLDLFFTDEETTREIFRREFSGKIGVIEGVMGLYDGLGGTSEEASTYHLARTLEAPILLVVNARGAGRSVLAEIQGFLDYDKDNLIRGILLNWVSPHFGGTLQTLIEENLHIPVLGFLPNNERTVGSRHLGLVLPEEIPQIREELQSQAEEMEQYVDIPGIIQLATDAAPLPEAPAVKENSDLPEASVRNPDGKPIRIAIAKDEAFCFYYRENLEMLERLGAELVPFSPLRDAHLPANIQGILLGGGYPELHLPELTRNEIVRGEIRKMADEGMPLRAECGGFMYLGESIQDEDGRDWPMLGVHSGKSQRSRGRRRFGYITLTSRESGRQIQAHEFHYYDSDANGEAYQAVKPVTGKAWNCIIEQENQMMGFPHLYYPSNPAFAEEFVEQCRSWHPSEIVQGEPDDDRRRNVD